MQPLRMGAVLYAVVDDVAVVVADGAMLYAGVDDVVAVAAVVVVAPVILIKSKISFP